MRNSCAYLRANFNFPAKTECMQLREIISVNSLVILNIRIFKDTLGQYKIKDEDCGFPGTILSTLSVSMCVHKVSVCIYSESF